MWYATLAQALKELVVTPGESSDDENVYVLQALEWVSQRIDHWPSLGFEFAPRKATRYLDAPAAIGLNSWGPSPLSPDYEQEPDLKLALGHPLLELTEVIDGMGHTLTQWDGDANTRANADFTRYPRGETPTWTLRMLPESAHSWTNYLTDPVEAIVLTGTWGYRSRYGEAWKASGAATAAELNDSATVVAVTDAAPFSPGQLIQIDDEWASVQAVTPAEDDDGTNTITLASRGERGTAAEAHSASAPVAIFHPEPMIVRACALWVAYLYARRGNYAAKQIEGFTVITFPPDAPPEVAAILETFAPKSQSDDAFAWGAV